MKKAMRNYGIFAIALLALTLAFSTVTLANDEGGKNHVTELKFIGNQENNPIFQLNFTNTVEDEFTVIFRDEHGNMFYNDKFKGANITKKFMLKTEDLLGTNINVIVRSKKGVTEVYTINRRYNYVEETVVNKVK